MRLSTDFYMTRLRARLYEHATYPVYAGALGDRDFPGKPALGL
jgi:hypothetical protein